MGSRAMVTARALARRKIAVLIGSEVQSSSP